MRDATTHNATDDTDVLAAAGSPALPASYEEIYAAEDYMAIIDAAYGPEDAQAAPALH